ncbi:hypothetical protein F4775DRAFT_530741 [Biscogniauxia sp. FL1348]|nr:hypothetical protein F4775DRAFT_530741 [Biscogniauxia sp. FL1348]
MTAPSEPRVRAKKPKVRTGCVNCKQRRIKCDENQPTCYRCQKARLACRYDPLKLKPGEGRPFRPIRPAAGHYGLDNNTTNTTNNSNNPSDPSPGTTIKSSNLNATEAGYFDVFRTSVVDNLCQNGYKNLWSQTMLRESMRDECIRDCVIGIGALYRALLYETTRGPALIPLWKIPTARMSKYHHDATLYYMNALASFRARLNSPKKTSPRTMLIVSILFLVYEVMQGNCESVDSVAHRAIEALKGNLGSLRPEIDPRTQVGSALDDEGVREADYFLLRLVTFGACCSPLYHSQWKSDAYEETWPLASTVPDWKASQQEILAAYDRHNTAGLVWGFRAYQGTVVGTTTNAMKLQKGQSTIISQSLAWCRFMQDKLRVETDPRQQYLWKVLLSGAKIQAIFGTYYDDKAEEERVWDTRASDCLDAISLVESIVDGWKNPSGFPPMFEDKVFPVIRGVITRCRDRKARFRALELCRRLVGPWWENRTILIGYEALVAYEESARDANGHIPYKARYQWIGYQWDEDHTALTLHLKNVTTQAPKQLTVRTEDLEYGRMINPSPSSSSSSSSPPNSFPLSVNAANTMLPSPLSPTADGGSFEQTYVRRYIPPADRGLVASYRIAIR